MEMVTAWWACTDVDGCGHGNFGDVLTPYIIKALTGYDVEHSKEIDHILMCGSVLDQSNENSIILGAGFMSESDKFNAAKDISLVRGIISKSILNQFGHGQNAMVGDPAIVLPLLYRPNVHKKHKVGLIPHYTDMEAAKKYNMTRIIDLTWPVEQVIDWICECEFIASTSLHGVIVAQTYGIPAAWIRLSDNLAGDDLKFRDYIETNARTMPRYPIDLRYDETNNVKYYQGNFENRKQVYNLLNKRLNELFPAR